MADDRNDRERSITIKRLLACADDHLDVSDEERGDYAHRYVVEAFDFASDHFPQYAENPPLELMQDILERLIKRDGHWVG